jgi:hypothetical protein
VLTDKGYADRKWREFPAALATNRRRLNCLAYTSTLQRRAEGSRKARAKGAAQNRLRITTPTTHNPASSFCSAVTVTTPSTRSTNSGAGSGFSTAQCATGSPIITNRPA